MNELRDFLLVAEDDADDQYLLEMAFREKGYAEKLEFVPNGLELLSRLLPGEQQSQKLPQLIMLDLNMPRKGGKETLRELKQHSHLRGIPVVIFSTTTDRDEIKACYELGANTYIVKPHDYTALLTAVSMIHSYWFNTASRSLTV